MGYRFCTVARRSLVVACLLSAADTVAPAFAVDDPLTAQAKHLWKLYDGCVERTTEIVKEAPGGGTETLPGRGTAIDRAGRMQCEQIKAMLDRFYRQCLTIQASNPSVNCDAFLSRPMNLN